MPQQGITVQRNGGKADEAVHGEKKLNQPNAEHEEAHAPNHKDHGHDLEDLPMEEVAAQEGLQSEAESK